MADEYESMAADSSGAALEGDTAARRAARSKLAASAAAVELADVIRSALAAATRATNGASAEAVEGLDVASVNWTEGEGEGEGVGVGLARGSGTLLTSHRHPPAKPTKTDAATTGMSRFKKRVAGATLHRPPRHPGCQKLSPVDGGEAG